MEKNNVFVYGTLMTGLYNHRLMAGADFLGPASISGYELYDLGWYPGIIPGGGTVLGELYSVDYYTLAALDNLESNGELYLRTETSCTTENGEKLTAWVYVYLHDVSRFKRIPLEAQPYTER